MNRAEILGRYSKRDGTTTVAQSGKMNNLFNSGQFDEQNIEYQNLAILDWPPQEKWAHAEGTCCVAARKGKCLWIQSWGGTVQCERKLPSNLNRENTNPKFNLVTPFAHKRENNSHGSLNCLQLSTSMKSWEIMNATRLTRHRVLYRSSVKDAIAKYQSRLFELANTYAR